MSRRGQILCRCHFLKSRHKGFRKTPPGPSGVDSVHSLYRLENGFIKHHREGYDDDDVLLNDREATRYRALSARLNYLAQDRPDLLYAVKEVARRMSTPTCGDWTLMKRVGRYLIGAPRAIQHFPWQQLQASIDTFVDSDWAGCKSSCRSTSGGVTKIGWHTIRAWSTTQATVAMSSAEAELYALTKGAANTLGFIELLKDLGQEVDATVHTDASATLGIVQRQGLGKLHVRVQYLWVQDRVRDGDFCVRKVPGKQNPADMMTKHLPLAEVLDHLSNLGFGTSQTRAPLAPQLSRVATRDHDNNGMDHWLECGNSAMRVHRAARTQLFTPIRVSEAPPAKTLTATRVTRGKYVDNGEEFEWCDNWTSRGTAHRCMARRWVGTTTFIRRSSSVLFSSEATLSPDEIFRDHVRGGV